MEHEPSGCPCCDQKRAALLQIERLEKLEIPNLKIERDGAKYESDKFEKERDDALVQIEALTKPDMGHWSTMALALKAAQLQVSELKDKLTINRDERERAERASEHWHAELQKAKQREVSPEFLHKLDGVTDERDNLLRLNGERLRLIHNVKHAYCQQACNLRLNEHTAFCIEVGNYILKPEVKRNHEEKA